MKLRVRKGGGNYYTYEVTLPKKLVEALGWREGMKLAAEIHVAGNTKGILIRPSIKE